MLSPEEIRRYSRHLLIPEFGTQGQLRLKTARVLVIGCGGLGSPILLYLAAAGVGTIGVVDGDRVDESNLQIQVLYGTESVGEPKVEEELREELHDIKDPEKGNYEFGHLCGAHDRDFGVAADDIGVGVVAGMAPPPGGRVAHDHE